MNLLELLILAVAINLCGFLIAYKLASDKLTDFSYGLTFLVLALVAFFSNEYSGAKLIQLVMVCLWSLRIAIFLLIRVLRNNKDRRFDGVREKFWKFAGFWAGQALTSWIVLMPSLFLFQDAGLGTKGLSIVGIVVFFMGLLIENEADLQKFEFNLKPSNKDRWIDRGLWRYSRHPNYFGEITVWVGVYLYAFGYLTVAQRVIGLVSPLFISFLLIFVTGIPKLEKYADQKWGKDPEYVSYKKHTSILFPLP